MQAHSDRRDSRAPADGESPDLLPRELVVSAFRMILGRWPESEAVIEHHRRETTEAELRRKLLKSAEFAEFFRDLRGEDATPAAAPAASGPAGGASGGAAGAAVSTEAAVAGADADGSGRMWGLSNALSVEVEAEGAERAALWARVAETWQRLGETVPHWSVLTHDAFRPEAIEANRGLFEGTAKADGVLIDCALARFPDFDPATATAVELGCGVGRATRALATRFAFVHGLDISLAHLAVAERELHAAGIGNVQFHRVRRIEDSAGPPGADFFYSRLVLQHNPPPVQAAILKRVLAGLAPGGIALFQALTHLSDYKYSVAADLRRSDGGMEMHALPQPAIFAILAEAGMTLLEVQEDGAAGVDGRHRSHSFLARKGA